ncbi:hypothetical protein [Reyranella sp.]|jgi:hypothetical protein|uniref:hypothetical protein n=1 Tax=Reyranella sp. TaxID=1929291 RepID=UPI000BD83EF8|nr:hypothetical protein [Reyranella sp.]OYY35600.1 MAG: hypothetical protein B7Y57_25815 [Rhodospirillales bacterium 35-66-84]OYZ91470.1 MAG: hypothetical protein B7Y08_25685 [Rhodospirillales bacterium 24-66-33]OZB22007.1 MAG: hypothetical protein B7X63_24610 [Rhodospirillales bacterium 39-66-50]HQS14974.1 hypothetical protein [Reyranella sp.]HQT10783.1 hypothetical protein [Reyranella sp.]
MTHQFREDGSHYNGGAVFFGYGYRAIGEPRLKMIRRWYRQGDKRGKTEDRFFVDGVEVENYTAAINALSIPVAFTPEEVAALHMIADESSDLRSVIKFEIRQSLRDKGAIEYGPPGSFRRTDIGRAALVTP